MYKAIIARYVGPTNTKPSRIAVWAEGCPRKYYSMDYSLSVDDNFQAAATAYRTERGWRNNGSRLIAGSINSSDVAFVMEEN